MAASHFILAGLADLADEAQTADRNIKHQQGVDSNANPIFDHARSAEDACAGGERPGNQDQIDGDSHNSREAERAEDRGYHEREQGVTDDTDWLEEGAAGDC